MDGYSYSSRECAVLCFAVLCLLYRTVRRCEREELASASGALVIA